MNEEKIRWSEQQITEYFGDEILVLEFLKELEKTSVPPSARENAKEFVEVVKSLKGTNERCEYKSEGICSIKLRPCMYRAGKICPTYKNKGRHFLLSMASYDLGPEALDLLIAHPFFESLVKASNKIKLYLTAIALKMWP